MQTNYLHRLTAILVFVDDHLSESLHLEQLAKLAHYSPYHLHRLFKAVTAETLQAYIQRKRIEKAILLLTQEPELKLADIGIRCGYPSNSSFSRAFKQFTGNSPANYRKLPTKTLTQIQQQDSKPRQSDLLSEEYLCRIQTLNHWTDMNAHITLQQLPEISYLYYTQLGTNGIENTFHKIIGFAQRNRIFENPEHPLIRVFHDSFKITDENKVRMSIGVVCKLEKPPHEAVNKGSLPAGKYLVGRYELNIPDFEKAWNGLFLKLSEMGYKKREGFPYELYQNNPENHPQKKCVVDLCIPFE